MLYISITENLLPVLYMIFEVIYYNSVVLFLLSLCIFSVCKGEIIYVYFESREVQGLLGTNPQCGACSLKPPDFPSWSGTPRLSILARYRGHRGIPKIHYYDATFIIATIDSEYYFQILNIGVCL